VEAIDSRLKPVGCLGKSMIKKDEIDTSTWVVLKKYLVKPTSDKLLDASKRDDFEPRDKISVQIAFETTEPAGVLFCIHVPPEACPSDIEGKFKYEGYTIEIKMAAQNLKHMKARFG
jgi:hypothetical protein